MEKPKPPSGLAPGTREHWIPWHMKLHGWSATEAEAHFMLYEEQMNRAAWERYRSDLAVWNRRAPLQTEGE